MYWVAIDCGAKHNVIGVVVVAQLSGMALECSVAFADSPGSCSASAVVAADASRTAIDFFIQEIDVASAANTVRLERVVNC